MGKSQHKQVAQADAHTAFRYVAADLAALNTFVSGSFASDDVGLLALQADIGAVWELSDAATPTWTCIHPGSKRTNSDPTVNDDQTDGYLEGYLWLNTATGKAFVLRDRSTGAAVWAEVAAANVVQSYSKMQYAVPVALSIVTSAVALDASLSNQFTLAATGDASSPRHQTWRRGWRSTLSSPAPAAPVARTSDSTLPTILARTAHLTLPCWPTANASSSTAWRSPRRR